MQLARRVTGQFEQTAPTAHFLKVGAVFACASGAMSLVGSMLHGPADVTTNGLHHLAVNGHFGIYRADHFLLVLALICALCGYAAIADSMKRHGANWARFGLLLAQLGTAVMMVALGIDGFAMVSVARAWAGASGAEQQMIFQVAQALWSAFVGIFALGVFVFFGCAPLVFGVALRSQDSYPAWLGYAALLGGAIGMVLGVTLAFVPITFFTYAALFGASSTLLAAWISVAGFHIWRIENGVQIPDEGRYS
jgi:hypothetical protein